MSDWFETMEDQFWLHPDEVGQREAQFVLKALHLRRGDAVLDAPCGAGRVSFHLARAGCVVTGLDLRETFIRRARLRLRTAGLHGTFRALDLRRVNAENQFEGILNWAGSFGYFTAAENGQLIAAFVRALRPGGYLLVEQPNREHLLRHLRPVMRKGTTVFQSRWDGQSQRVITRRIVAEVEDRRNSSSMRLYTPAQMRVLFEQHGLIVEQLHKSIRFDAYGPSAPRMIIVGRKARKGSKMVQRTGASRVAQSEMRTPSAAGSHR